jgi:2-polyprenyl-6-methoxyphenol hydroxylase-like FAD-dependent oxidoreductase
MVPKRHGRNRRCGSRGRRRPGRIHGDRRRCRAGDGLASYEHLRRQRVWRVLESGKVNSEAKTLGPFQKRLADLLMPIFFRFLYQRSTAWLFTYDAANAA